MAGWTSVQIVTVVVAALTPLTVAALGYFVARAGQRIGQMQWANQTVVARRLDIFKEVAPQINRLLCFATLRGGLEGDHPTGRHRGEAETGRDDVRQPGAVLR